MVFLAVDFLAVLFFFVVVFLDVDFLAAVFLVVDFLADEALLFVSFFALEVFLALAADAFSASDFFGLCGLDFPKDPLNNFPLLVRLSPLPMISFLNEHQK